MFIQMPGLSPNEIFMLDAVQNEEDLKRAENRVRLAREGQLPDDWYLTPQVAKRFSEINLRRSA